MKDVIPAAYDGREQALVKHNLLESYLQKLFLIKGMSARQSGKVQLFYVDCFAGPWGDESNSMETTSIAISLRTLDICRQTLGRNGISADIRALFIEQNAKSFARLSAYLEKSSPSGIRADCRLGDFMSLREEILLWAGQDAFVFFFIDPTGWKEVGIETLRSLLKRRRSEFLINFMYNDVNRTMSMDAWKAPMADLLGATISLDGMQPHEREEAILRTYRANLKACLPATNVEYRARSAYVRVLDPRHDRPKYHLVYITSHARGVIEFMDISEGVDLVQKRVRAAKKGAEREAKSRTVDMFSHEPMIDLTAGHADRDDVDYFWTGYLANGVCRVGVNEFADILESKEWFPGDLQASLARLISSGLIRNLDATGKRPKKPLHFDLRGGERLELINSPKQATP